MFPTKDQFIYYSIKNKLSHACVYHIFHGLLICGIYHPHCLLEFRLVGNDIALYM